MPPLDAPMDDQKNKALVAALAQIEKQFGKGSIMKMGEAQIANDLHGRLHRLARPRYRPRRRRPAPRPRGRDLRSRVVRQDHAVPAGRRADPEGRRRRRLHRRRERARPGLRRQARRERRRPPASRSRTRASRRWRSPTCWCAPAASTSSSSTRSRPSCPRPKSKARWATSCPGLQARLMSQALRKLDRQHQAHQHAGDLHQPDPHEDRRDVRQPRNHHRRQRAQVLRLGAPGHPPHRLDQEGRRGRRQRDARQGRQEQGGAAVPRGAVRHPLRRGHLARRRDHRARRRTTASSTSPAPGTPTTATRSARARTTRASTCASIPRSPRRSRRGFASRRRAVAGQAGRSAASRRDERGIAPALRARATRVSDDAPRACRGARHCTRHAAPGLAQGTRGRADACPARLQPRRARAARLRQQGVPEAARIERAARRARGRRATCRTRAMPKPSSRTARAASASARSSTALKERGIAQADADQAHRTCWRGADELEDAIALWQRRFGAPPADDREKARQVRFLQAAATAVDWRCAVLKRAGRGRRGRGLMPESPARRQSCAAWM